MTRDERKAATLDGRRPSDAASSQEKASQRHFGVIDGIDNKNVFPSRPLTASDVEIPEQSTMRHHHHQTAGRRVTPSFEKDL